MANKKVPDRVWVVVSSDGKIEGFPTQMSAHNAAKEHLEINDHEEVFVFEVVQAWTIQFPEEPAPEAYSIGLEDI